MCAAFDISKPGPPWGKRICFEEPNQPDKALPHTICRLGHGSG